MNEHMNFPVLEEVSLHTWIENNKALSVFHKNKSIISRKKFKKLF